MNRWPVAGVLGIWVLLLLLGGARSEEKVPVPTPTDAAAQAARRLEVRGESILEQGEEARQRARGAALLNAYRELVRQVGGEPAGAYRIDVRHPDFATLAWVLRSEVTGESISGGRLILQVRSPPLGERVSVYPPLVRTTSFDLDRDGFPETVGAGYDGRIYVLRQRGTSWDVLGSTASLAAFSWRGEAIRLDRLDSLESVEPAGADRARVVAVLSRLEAVEGRIAGHVTERREVLVSLAPPRPGPRLELLEPADFSRTFGSRIPLRGTVEAASGLAQTRLRLNGRLLWEDSRGLEAGSRRLQLEMVLDLIAGTNRLGLEAVDREGRRLEREIVVEREGGKPPAGARLALVAGRDGQADWGDGGSPEGDARALAEWLENRGYEVDLLLGPEATAGTLRGRIADLAHRATPGDTVVFYFAGISSLGAPGGKSLQLAGGRALRARELAGWLEPLDSLRQVVLLDTAAPGEVRVDARWFDGSEFLDCLEAPGRVLLAGGDPVPRRWGSEKLGGGVFTRTLLEVLQARPQARLEELYGEVARRVLRRGGPAPLLRGRPIGRVTLGE